MGFVHVDVPKPSHVLLELRDPAHMLSGSSTNPASVTRTALLQPHPVSLTQAAPASWLLLTMLLCTVQATASPCSQSTSALMAST
jgi:hypothetical protein